MLRVLVLLVAIVGLPVSACMGSFASETSVIVSWVMLAVGCMVAVVAVTYGKKDLRPHWRRPIAGERPTSVIARELRPILWMYNIHWIVAVSLVTLAVCLGLMAWQFWPGEMLSVARTSAKKGYVFAALGAICAVAAFTVRMWLMEKLREQAVPLVEELRASHHVESTRLQQGSVEPWLADNQGDWPKL